MGCEPKFIGKRHPPPGSTTQPARSSCLTSRPPHWKPSFAGRRTGRCTRVAASANRPISKCATEILSRARLPYTAGVNRVGLGYDVHQLKTGQPLILGGVEIPHDTGLDGHSDADIIMHAICDAVLGALGEGDIGSFFPPSDPQWKNAQQNLPREAARQIESRGGRLINVDAMLIAEAPKIAPHVTAMKANIATASAFRPMTSVSKPPPTKPWASSAAEKVWPHAVASVELPN